MNSIYEIINKNESVCAVFTTHEEWSSNLEIKSDSTGFTGDWLLGRRRHKFEFVIIYHRPKTENNIYKARVRSVKGPLPQYQPKERFRINFRGFEQLGTTSHNWSEFADCGSNPVRYFNIK